MLTLLGYVLIVGVVAGVLFLLASMVFGRGEELGPLPEGTTATVLPAESITGADVRALRFQQVVRGYKAGEVDWALARLAARIDELQAELAQARAAAAPAGDTPTEIPRPRTVEATGPRPADTTAPPADRVRTDPPVSNGRTQP
ncbi:DivIVA domain-containing protein [Nocardia shimofusensis]|uniref:DivIVA domain-containing protein n=1 Tax=Nocardia shimofusensis TaxID=228596 RepID=UPI00082E34F8|nr:DivIVA domain-containing protein [Nocardia shimofusensis]